MSSMDMTHIHGPVGKSPCGHTQKWYCQVRRNRLLCYFSERLQLSNQSILLRFYFPMYFLLNSIIEQIKILTSFYGKRQNPTGISLIILSVDHIILTSKLHRISFCNICLYIYLDHFSVVFPIVSLITNENSW